ncbi:MAG: PD40 domain-containing protein [Anaerolineae bacterium]|nr:PD40 domain-containing protein [Anaerolineae bacterium]
MSQDGTKAAVAWSNGDVTLYPLTSAGLGPPMQRWVSGQPFHGAFALTFAAADSMLIWAIKDELVRIDLATMTVLPALNNHRGRVAALASSPTTPHWALAAEDTVWLYHDDTPPIPLTGHTQAATSIRFSPDGQLLATGDSRGTVWLWRVSDGRLLKTLTGHQQIITELTFSPDGAWLLSGSQDRTVRFWGVHSR